MKRLFQSKAKLLSNLFAMNETMIIGDDDNAGLSRVPIFDSHDIGITLLKSCINDLMKRNAKYCVPDFLDVADKTTTKARVIAGADGKKQKEFTTIFDAINTIFILNYTVPCDILIPNFTTKTHWHAIHYSDDLAFNAECMGTMSMTGVFVSSSD